MYFHIPYRIEGTGIILIMYQLRIRQQTQKF